MNKKETKKKENLTERPPVIAVLGHIDHGKSTLLDYIRKTTTTDKEVGGITQNMSAYEVSINDKRITFLDTPGHEAFKELRGRGTNVADLAILVVSAEDGVKAQTIEALKSIEEAELPFVVAINKIDRPSADIDRTKQNLAENNIYVEGYGGNIPFVAISAKTGQGVPELLDLLLLVSELEELKADPSTHADGIIIETNRDKERGISATLIIKNGVLKTGMTVVSGESIAPVRIFQDFQGKKIDSATFSTPVKVVGFNSLPHVGMPFVSFESKKEAELAARSFASSSENTMKKSVEQDERFNIPVIIKASTSGVLEAIEYELRKFENEKVVIKIIYSGVGDINESDIKNASGNQKTLVLGFNTKVDASARAQAERLEISIQTFDIIYKLTDWLKDVVEQRTPKSLVEEEKGRIKVLKLFSKVKEKQILGGRVETGSLNVGDDVRIIRRDTEIGAGKVRELQQAKSKTSEVKEGLEFGSMIESKIEIAPGDILKAMAMVEK